MVKFDNFVIICNDISSLVNNSWVETVFSYVLNKVLNNDQKPVVGQTLTQSFCFVSRPLLVVDHSMWWLWQETPGLATCPTFSTELPTTFTTKAVAAQVWCLQNPPFPFLSWYQSISNAKSFTGNRFQNYGKIGFAHFICRSWQRRKDKTISTILQPKNNFPLFWVFPPLMWILMSLFVFPHNHSYKLFSSW